MGKLRYSIIAITSSLVFCTLLSGCGASKELKQKAKEVLNENKSTVEEKVKQAYGEDAQVFNLKCKVESYGGSPVPSISYGVSDNITGKMLVNSKVYSLYYNIERGEIYDSVNISKISNDIIAEFPIDSSYVYDCVFIDSNRSEPKFISGIDSFENLANYGDMSQVSLYGNAFWMYIFTTEDISKYSEYDFSLLTKIINPNFRCNYTIIQLDNTNQGTISQLKASLDSIDFSYDKPINYKTNIDALKQFNIKRTINIKMHDMTNKVEVKCNEGE